MYLFILFYFNTLQVKLKMPKKRKQRSNCCLPVIELSPSPLHYTLLYSVNSTVR